MKLPFPKYGVLLIVLFSFVAHVLAVAAIHLGAVGETFQNTEEVTLHSALAVRKYVLRVSIAALIFLEDPYHVNTSG